MTWDSHASVLIQHACGVLIARGFYASTEVDTRECTVQRVRVYVVHAGALVHDCMFTYLSTCFDMTAGIYTSTALPGSQWYIVYTVT